MSTYTASVRVDEDMLHVSRPLTAPDPITAMVEAIVYDMTKEGGAAGSGVTAIRLEVDTAGESDTPIGDSIAGTSSTPLTAADPDPDTAEVLEPAGPVGVRA